YTASMTLLASGANAIPFSWFTIVPSITEGVENPLTHELPLSALVDLRAFASTSCWRIGPPVWMNFPVETPMELARGNVHVAAGSSNVFHVDQLIVVPVTTARMWLVRPFWPSNAMLMSAWTTSVGALFRYAMPSARPPPRKPFGEPASAGGLSAPATHVAVARSGPDEWNDLTMWFVPPCESFADVSVKSHQTRELTAYTRCD